jgi:hypothetical protein
MKEDKMNATGECINILVSISKFIGVVLFCMIVVLAFLYFNILGLEDCNRYCYSDPCYKSNINKVLNFLAPCMLIISSFYLLWFSGFKPMVRKSD